MPRFSYHHYNNEASIITTTISSLQLFASVTTKSQCSSPHCSLSMGHSREVPLLSVNEGILQAGGVNKLQAALEEGLLLNPSTCLRPLKTPEECPDSLKSKDPSSQKCICRGSVTHNYTTGQLLCIETSADTYYPVSEFPVNLQLNKQSFTLRGIVAFIPGPSKDALGHYVAFCRRSSFVWEKYDDLSNHTTTVSEKTKIQPHVVLFTKDS